MVCVVYVCVWNTDIICVCGVCVWCNTDLVCMWCVFGVWGVCVCGLILTLLRIIDNVVVVCIIMTQYFRNNFIHPLTYFPVLINQPGFGGHFLPPEFNKPIRNILVPTSPNLDICIALFKISSMYHYFCPNLV